MPPLTRQQTFGSTRSWWSDRNPNLRASPTINIHAVAKPLMKLLYNRQALEFISTIDHGIPLSAKDAEIYGSYLSCEYVSASTKSAILQNLSWRTYSEHDALVVHTHIFHDIVDMLEAPYTAGTEWRYPAIFQILSHLALHESSAESTAMATVRMLPLNLLGTSLRIHGTVPSDSQVMWQWVDLVSMKLLEAPCQATAEATCGSLVALVCDSDMPQVVDGALWLLSRVRELKFPLVTAGVSVKAKVLDHIMNMLEAPNTAKW
ncbi:hypothetical protein C8J57DRAFT_1466584, partial [Mycena rebaudengoi]